MRKAFIPSSVRNWILRVFVAYVLLLLLRRLEKSVSVRSDGETTVAVVDCTDRKLPLDMPERDRHPIPAEKQPMPNPQFEHRNLDNMFDTLKQEQEKQTDDAENEVLSDEAINDVDNDDPSDFPERASGYSMKTIIWYDIYNAGLGMRNLAKNVDFSQCKYSSCQIKFTLDPDDDPNPKDPLDGDAVLIQLVRIMKFPPLPKRDSDQVFVVVEREATPLGEIETAPKSRVDAAVDLWSNVINWTMTYRLDSDITYTYSSIHPRETGNVGPTKDYDKIFNEKSKHAAWFVSHCKTRSRRMDYVKELQEFTDVDILGECGRQDPCPMTDKDCPSELAGQYKFYLAFENSFHTDYITEKFFEWYQRDVITVVRGGANYSKFAHPDTYINARDFASPAELGRFLNKLGQDKARYIEYLERKDQYYVLGQRVQTQNAYCTLCEWLHSLNSHRKWYPHIGKWWLKGYFNFRNDKYGRWRGF